jgi:hypothetical protein
VAESETTVNVAVCLAVLKPASVPDELEEIRERSHAAHFDPVAQR